MSQRQSQLKLSKGERRKKFGKWINYDLLHEARGYGSLVTNRGPGREWPDPTCSRCGSSAVKYHRYFQDWCLCCYSIKLHEWWWADMQKHIKKARQWTRSFLLKMAHYFDDPSPYTRR